MQGAGSALFVMPRPSRAWASAGALWITAAGWAKAAESVFEDSRVLTPDGNWTADEVLGFAATATVGETVNGWRSRLLRRVPTVAKTAVKDALLAVRATRASQEMGRRRFHPEPTLVWQHHDPFGRGGEKIARAHSAPLVVYVHAPQVWEGALWGVRRPGWGKLIELIGEAPAIQAADLVACVSEEVADELSRFGVSREKIQVSPMSVDTERFHPGVEPRHLRQRYGIDDRFVVGWTGSFRSFHGLEQALEAFALLGDVRPRPTLFLVGEGQERPQLERMAQDLGIADRVVFSGAVPFDDMPAYVAAMDATLVVAREGQSFHYSPLKLREYWACGKPAIVPRIGEMARIITPGENGFLFSPGNVQELSSLIEQLAESPELCERVGKASAETIQRTGTWDIQLTNALETLASRGWELPGVDR